MAIGRHDVRDPMATAPRIGARSKLTTAILRAVAQLHPLTKLRFAFVGLALALLLPLALLLYAAGERVEEQRRLRHQMVSERIFDELERELTDLLEREAARSSQAYDRQTSPDAWAPFVVSYFVADRFGERPVSSVELTPQRRSALRDALSRWRVIQERTGEPERPTSQGDLPVLPTVPQPKPSRPPSSRARPPAPRSATQQSQSEGAAETSASPKSSPEVLRQLNRAKAARRRAAPASPATEADPLQDYHGY